MISKGDVPLTYLRTILSHWEWHAAKPRTPHITLYFTIPLTISTTKRVNTCLIPSPVSWRIQAKKMGPCTSFCSKRACTVSCSGVPFGTQKSEMHFVVIYFGMRCVVPETPKPSFAGHARLHEHIAWTLRPFLALNSQLFRGKMSPQKTEKKQIM